MVDYAVIHPSYIYVLYGTGIYLYTCIINYESQRRRKKFSEREAVKQSLVRSAAYRYTVSSFHQGNIYTGSHTVHTVPYTL